MKSDTEKHNNTENHITIAERRLIVSKTLRGSIKGLVAVVGPCSNQIDRRIVNEGRQLAKLGHVGLTAIHRVPPWKPRTPVAGTTPWKGLHVSNPVAALSRLEWEARRQIPLAIELGEQTHIARYQHILTFGWLGARSHGNNLLDMSVSSDSASSLPIGVKNDLDGTLISALDRIAQINKMRHRNSDNPASITLIFRGGTNFTTPDLWEQQYKIAHELTNGNLIVDTAHGSEMAFDPGGNFSKSVDGQKACLDRVLELASDGFVPTGIMIEASDHVVKNPARQTDPNMPFDIAVQDVIELNKLVINRTVSNL